MLISKKKKALVLRLRDPSKITSVIPGAKVFEYNGKQFVAVKHGVDEVKVLRNLGFDAPAPILHYYDWPASMGIKPFHAQREAAAFLTSHRRAFNLSEIGTGKSLATLWAYDYLRSRGVIKKMLVVAPLSTLERTWADEVWQHFPHLNAVVVYGTGPKRRALLAQDADIYIINHDGFKVKGIVEDLAARPDIDLIVIDEVSQAARNAGTDRFRHLNTVVNKQSSRWAWGLTGTPIPNRPTDAWAQCRLLVPERVPNFFLRFRDMVERQVTNFLWIARDNALKVVEDAMQPAIRFTRDECMDLPPCTFTTRQVKLTAAQAKAYKEMMTKLKTELAAGEVLAVNEAVKAGKLIQILCIAHGTPVLTDAGWVPIQEVTRAHRVWDGVEWVSHEGVAYKGDRQVVEVDGVLMTEDHEVLTEKGWATAKEIINGKSSEGLNRVTVRLPDRFATGGFNVGDDAVRDVEVRTTGTYRTYDIVKCGPRSRFTVRGTNGELLIVHNCGSTYGDDKEILFVDAKPRLEVTHEIIEEAGAKVIVFVPFVSAVHLVAKYLRDKGITVECIYGEVSKTERDRIFTAFQKSSEPRVIVAQPAAMSHGLTLTAANTIIWYAPITSNDTFVQANGRVTRPGQKNKQLIVMLEGTDIERKYYSRLQHKQKVQGALLDAIKEARL